jgi:hypothetical protein
MSWLPGRVERVARSQWRDRPGLLAPASHRCSSTTVGPIMAHPAPTLSDAVHTPRLVTSAESWIAVAGIAGSRLKSTIQTVVPYNGGC